jgi:hypothetical protein
MIECRRLCLRLRIRHDELGAAAHGLSIHDLVRVVDPAHLIGHPGGKRFIPIPERHRPLVVGERPLREGGDMDEGDQDDGGSAECEHGLLEWAAIIA